MKKLDHHFFVCGSFRVQGAPQGVCYKKSSMALVQYLENEIIDRGLDNSFVSTTGCLKLCDKGPVMVDYPSGDWYGNISEPVIDSILDAIENGEKATQYLISSE